MQRRWRAGPLGSVRRRAMFVCVGLLFYRNVLTAQEQEDQDDSSDGDSESADDEGWPGAGLLYRLVLVGGGTVTAKEKIAGWRDRRRDQQRRSSRKVISMLKRIPQLMRASFASPC